MNKITQQPPLVSIGLPVYNGVATLERAIDSLLKQDFADFELLLSDDASTDATPQLCEAYAERDARVKFIRNARNLGYMENFSQVLNMACGEYFLYASQDDIWDPSFIGRMVRELKNNWGSVAAMCAYRTIYPSGEDAGTIRLAPEDWPQRRNYFSNALAVISKRGKRMRPIKTNAFVHGLVRTNIFRESFRAVTGWYVNERQLVCQFALAGKLIHVDEVLFTKQRSRQPLAQRAPTDPLVRRRNSSSYPNLWYVAGLWRILLRSRVVPIWRKAYVVPMSIAFLWEANVLSAYSRILEELRSILPTKMLHILQRLRRR